MTSTASATAFLSSVLRWLRAGYPEGVPGPDRVPLLALLRATPLTEDQIKQVVRDITAPGSAATADGVIDRDEIAEFISEVTHYDAGPENIQRVAGVLAAGRNHGRGAGCIDRYSPDPPGLPGVPGLPPPPLAPWEPN